MHQDKDRSAKWLIAHHGDAILKLAGIAGFTSWGTVASEVVAPRRLPDGLMQVTFRDELAPSYVLVEVETYPGADTDRQVFEDLLAIRLDRNVIPDVVTLILRPKGNQDTKGFREESNPRGTVRVTGSWPVIKLWELEAEGLLAAGDVGLIPWVPLTKSTMTPLELLTRCRDRIAEVADKRDRLGLLSVTQILARVTFPGPQFANFFGGVEAMIESPALDEFKEVVSKRAKIEGATDATRQNTLDNLELRFGPVPLAVSAKLAEIKDATRLRELHRLSVTCPTLDAFVSVIEGN